MEQYGRPEKSGRPKMTGSFMPKPALFMAEKGGFMPARPIAEHRRANFGHWFDQWKPPFAPFFSNNKSDLRWDILPGTC